MKQKRWWERARENGWWHEREYKSYLLMESWLKRTEYLIKMSREIATASHSSRSMAECDVRRNQIEFLFLDLNFPQKFIPKWPYLGLSFVDCCQTTTSIFIASCDFHSTYWFMRQNVSMLRSSTRYGNHLDHWINEYQVDSAPISHSWEEINNNCRYGVLAFCICIELSQNNWMASRAYSKWNAHSSHNIKKIGPHNQLHGLISYFVFLNISKSNRSSVRASTVDSWCQRHAHAM